jgi:C_GCAxxG_C_C family probable redox protein
MNRVESAVGCFQSGGNCAQAILSTYGQPYGLDESTALKLSAGFGGGMGRLGEVCGAVTGAFMVLGLHVGAASAGDAQGKERTYALVAEFARRFEARRGCLHCRQLLGCDLNTPEGLQAAKDRKLFTTLCPCLVAEAATILEEMLGPTQPGAGTGAVPHT